MDLKVSLISVTPKVTAPISFSRPFGSSFSEVAASFFALSQMHAERELMAFMSKPPQERVLKHTGPVLFVHPPQQQRA